MKTFSEISWHDEPYEDPCRLCGKNTEGYVWTDGTNILYALPCGHSANSRRKLTPAEVAFVLLMEPKP